MKLNFKPFLFKIELGGDIKSSNMMEACFLVFWFADFS